MVRLAENKHYCENKAIERLPLPPKVYLPLIQHLGKICDPEVKVGDIVANHPAETVSIIRNWMSQE